MKPAYRTENTLVFIVPTVSKSCQGTLITSSCPNGYAQSKLSVVVGAPTAYMFYNEFVPDGEYLKVKGNSFVGDQLEVDFVGKDGSAIAVSGDNLVKKGDDGTELWVKVPENVAESHPVTFKNNAEGKSTVSKIYFRDTRNMLIDFDNNVDRAYATGIYKKNKAGDEYSIADSSYDGNKLTDLIPPIIPQPSRVSILMDCLTLQNGRKLLMHRMQIAHWFLILLCSAALPIALTRIMETMYSSLRYMFLSQCLWMVWYCL